MKKIAIPFILLSILHNSFGQVKDSSDDGRKIRIPVVFHIIYSNATENIADSLIKNELNDLNSDFSADNDMTMLDSEFKNLVGNANIEFYLLDTMLQSAGIKGIDRIRQTNDRNKYLINDTNCVNVFIASQGDATPCILGDRINLNYADVGKRSHVLTHETGHWLGLYHIFGQIGNSSWSKVLFGNHDDLIDDTPLQREATAICYSITPDCPCPPFNIYYKHHKTLYNNFMDYNPCRCMFTKKQCIRMRNNIIEHKPLLFSGS